LAARQQKSKAMLESKNFFGRVCEALGVEPDEAAAPKISKMLGISKNAIYLWQDQMPGMNKLQNVARVSELSNTSLHWLLTGTGPKWIPLQTESSEEIPVYFGEKEQEIISNLAAAGGRTFDEEVRELVLESLLHRGLITDQVEDGVVLEYFGDQVPKLVPMKLYGEIAAGEPIDVIEIEETVLVAEDFTVTGKDTYVLRVRGDSMIDEGIFDRDLIICHRADSANNGDKVVALIDGDRATVKKFYRERGRIRLQPANPKHDPIYLPPERVLIRGIVIGIQRRT
jgi:repressor LexA